MEIPKQWEIQTEEKLLHKINKKLNLNNVEKIDTSKKLKRLPSFLFSFEKDNRNKFTALLIPFDTSKEKIEHVFHLQRGRLYAGLAKYCIKVDSSWSREMIDKKVFIKSEITAYHDSTLVENQLSYSQVINNYCLFVLIFYDSQENKNIILNKWRNSKFEN